MNEKTPASTSSDYEKSEKRRQQKLEAGRRFRAKHRERVNQEATKRRAANKDKINARSRRAYQENKEAILARNANWARDNADKVKERQRLRPRARTTGSGTEQARRWREANRQRLREYTRDYEGRRRREDVLFRLAKNARGRLRQALQGGVKLGRTFDLIGCTPEQLKAYIEAKFAAGMTWENWGRDGWHIDHIRPLSSFDLTDECELKAACHFTNLQPLWAAENLSKGASYG